MKYIKLIRVKQWIKNGFLFLPLFFSGDLFQFNLIIELLVGVLAFSFVSSSIYVLNDYRDIESDRQHPVKKKRPLASGTISKSAGIVVMLLCFLGGMGLAFGLDPKFSFVLFLYFIMNVAYSLGLKNIGILDIMMISIGFVLRVKAGAVLTEIAVSQWLIVMVFLLALFLAVAKRRDDLILKLSMGLDVRKSSKDYNLPFLDGILILVSGVIIMVYLTYSLDPLVIKRLGTYRISYTTFFVIMGIFRYLQLAMVENNTGSPTELLYKDRVIQLSIGLWVLSYYLILYYPDIQWFD